MGKSKFPWWSQVRDALWRYPYESMPGERRIIAEYLRADSPGVRIVRAVYQEKSQTMSEAAYSEKISVATAHRYSQKEMMELASKLGYIDR